MPLSSWLFVKEIVEGVSFSAYACNMPESPFETLLVGCVPIPKDSIGGFSAMDKSQRAVRAAFVAKVGVIASFISRY